MHRPRPRRLAHFDYRGFHRYFLTFCTEQRRQHFTRPDVVLTVLAQFRRCAARHGIRLTAYCFMPDHLHALVEGASETADARAFIAAGRQASGYACRHLVTGRLWQHAGYERVLRREDATLAIARYVIENPVRAGLVCSPTDYPWSGSDCYTMDEILQAVAASRAPH
jgi:putative transposase